MGRSQNLHARAAIAAGTSGSRLSRDQWLTTRPRQTAYPSASITASKFQGPALHVRGATVSESIR
jgi:hypothetical protein